MKPRRPGLRCRPGRFFGISPSAGHAAPFPPQTRPFFLKKVLILTPSFFRDAVCFLKRTETPKKNRHAPPFGTNRHGFSVRKWFCPFLVLCARSGRDLFFFGDIRALSFGANLPRFRPSKTHKYQKRPDCEALLCSRGACALRGAHIFAFFRRDSSTPTVTAPTTATPMSTQLPAESPACFADVLIIRSAVSRNARENILSGRSLSS